MTLARASAWTTGVFGGLTCLGGVFGDIASLVVGAALIGVAVREARLARRLSQFELGAPRALAINQLVLGGVIVVYAVSQIWMALQAPGYAAQHTGDAKVDAMLGDIDGLTRRITVALYLVVGVVGVLGTALMAWAYARRARTVREFLATTEAWVLEVMRKAA